MRILKAPTRLKWTVTLLYLSIPMAILQLLVAARIQWWSLPLRQILIMSVLVGALCTFFAIFLIRGNRWAMTCVNISTILWTVFSGIHAFRMENYGMAFYSVFIAFYGLTLSFLISNETQRSFFDPRMKWFQGTPEKIPGLKCWFIDPATEFELKVGRFDEDGAFVYADSQQPSEKLKALLSDKKSAKKLMRKVDIGFEFQNRKIQCSGNVISVLEYGAGVGIQFRAMDFDARKDLGDFVEELKGMGYV
ncbi:MAG: hypothetical protein JNL01_11085 [Bdellovibrionales bacterium]|nr:hypothetical protein [Bdellovibrionales bacterium]